MSRLSIQDIASVLVKKHGLSASDANKFVTALFDVINDGLHSEKIVKIKGLGTFKVIDVRQRESVNVNTGERFVIEGHGKITFIPDPVVRDLVNKPFALFKEVELNDGVDFKMMGSVSEIELNKEEKAEVENNDEEENSFDDDDKIWFFHKKSVVITVIIIFVIVMFGGSYYWWHERMPGEQVAKQDVVADVTNDTTLAKDTATMGTEKQEKASQDIATQEKEGMHKENDEDIPRPLRNAMAIVNTGAYRIVGTDMTITVSKGDNIRRISKRYFGDGMESYVMVHNGIVEVEPGMKLKIPKLEYKKKK